VNPDDVAIPDLRLMRRQLGVSQAALAAEMGWTLHRLRKLERSDDPPLFELLLYVRTLGGDLHIYMDRQVSPVGVVERERLL